MGNFAIEIVLRIILNTHRGQNQPASDVLDGVYCESREDRLR